MGEQAQPPRHKPQYDYHKLVVLRLLKGKTKQPRFLFTFALCGVGLEGKGVEGGVNDSVFSPHGCSRLNLSSVRTRCSSGVLVRVRAFRDSEPPCLVDMEAYWSWIKVTQEALIGWAFGGLCLCALCCLAILSRACLSHQSTCVASVDTCYKRQGSQRCPGMVGRWLSGKGLLKEVQQLLYKLLSEN